MDRTFTNYHESEMRVLDAAFTRANPRMFIGNTDEAGLFHLIDDLLRFALSAACDTIGVTLGTNGSCSLTGNRLELSVLIEPQSGGSQIEQTFTTVPSFGRHHCGGMAIYALSEWCEVETSVGGQCYRIEFARGKVTKPVRCLGPSAGRDGTTIRFKPDPEIFESTTFDIGMIVRRLGVLAFLHNSTRFLFTDERTGKTDSIQSVDGLAAYVQYLNTGRTTLHKPIVFRGREGSVSVEIALQYHTDFETLELGYVNDDWTRYGGTHLTGLRRGLTTILKRFGQEIGAFPAGLSLTGSDFREGLTAVVSVRHPEPTWEGATRTSVRNPELVGIVSRTVRGGFEAYLNQNPEVGKRLCEHVARSAGLRIRVEESVHRVSTDQRPT